MMGGCGRLSDARHKSASAGPAVRLATSAMGPGGDIATLPDMKEAAN
jgi:hypothetical protein